MSNDETYLEAFVESIANLPHDLRRNLELLKELDKSCASLVDRLKTAEDAYLDRAQETILGLDVPMDESVDPPRPVVPTTEELTACVEDEEQTELIETLRAEALRKVDEKVTIVEQAYEMVDGTVRRLDSDLKKLETLLKSTGEFDALTGPKPNDLAAIQVNPNSPDWILAKVISYDNETGTYNLSDEDVESNKIFHLPESQVVVLGRNTDRLSRGDVIFAVYPDTTSFYQATVVQAPRKTGANAFVLVNFQDDGDEHGVTHDKPVLLKHVMRVPYGTTPT